MAFFKRKSYEAWIASFYEGSMLIPGWNSVSSDIMMAVPREHQDEVSVRLSRLGERISREWAKENEDRRIDSVLLQQWGNDLKAARSKGFDTLSDVLTRLEGEVTRLLDDSHVS